MGKTWIACRVVCAAWTLLLAAACGGGGGGGAASVTFVSTAGGTASDAAYAVATYADGSSVVTGTFHGTANWGLGEPNATTLASAGESDVFVARYHADGTLAWARRAGGSLSDRGQGIASIPDGSCIVTGQFRDEATFGPGEGSETTLDDIDDAGDVFVARYEADGTLAWAKRAGRNDADSGLDVAARPDGSSVVTGGFDLIAMFGPGEGNQTLLNAAGDRDVFIASYDPDGALAWARSAGGAGTDTGRGIDLRADGSILVTGYYGGPTATFGPGETNETTLPHAGAFDTFVARYAADGSLTWVRRVAGADFVEPDAVSAFSDGGFVVSGFFRGMAVFAPGETNQTTLLSVAGSNDWFLARYAADGALVWARQAGSSDVDEGALDVAALPDGGCIATGTTRETAIFDPGGPGETSVTSFGEGDVVLARYDASGTPLWVRQAGSTEHDRGYSVAPHTDGSFAVCGVVSPLAVFDPGAPGETTRLGFGNRDAFVARYGADGGL